jgi:uncharacterized protein (TIGR02246 family)
VCLHPMQVAGHKKETLIDKKNAPMRFANQHVKGIITIFMGTASAVVFFTHCSTATHPIPKDEKAVITAISASRAQAFNAGDAAGIAVHFTEDAILMAPGKPATTGRAAVQAYYQAIFDEYNTRLESHYDEVYVSDSLAYGRGSAKVTLLPKKGGEALVSTAKYLNILQKQADGSWKTTHDIWNSNETP